jgi:hypothetical protein
VCSSDLPLDFGPGWEERLRADIRTRGVLRTPGCSDYFIFPRDMYSDIPPFNFGRSAWDNWMIYHARRQGWPVVNVTPSVMVGHQNHDYSHLPRNEPPYRLPESQENIRMGGGRRTIFWVTDATRQLVDGKLQRIPPSWTRFWRGVEVFPLLALHSFVLANVSFALLRPRRAFIEWRPQLSRIKRKLFRQPPIQYGEPK